MIKEIGFVAICVTDPERARKFYQDLLGLKQTLSVHDGMWTEYEVGGTTIGVGCHPDWKPAREGTSVAFEVDDIDATIAKLKKAGVEFERDKFESPVCFMAVIHDPDGNRLLVHKRKTS